MEESVLVGHDVGSQVAFVSVGEASPCCVGCLVLGRVPSRTLARAVHTNRETYLLWLTWKNGYLW